MAAGVLNRVATRSDPTFLDTSDGRLFAVHHCPVDAQSVRGHVLCALPFNEEMNRCRSMVTLQAQAWAALGLGTLVIDPFGTGDSEGDFVDARWDAWQRNLRAGRDWLAQQPGGCRAVWGIRLGAILAASEHAEAGDPQVALLLWQPVVDGKTHLTQFFRVRIAAALDRADQPKETTASMRETLAAGTPVEVAGYEIHPALAVAIDTARLTAHPLPPGTRVLWLEQASGDGNEPGPATQATLKRWPGEACTADLRLFRGPSFWQVHERMVAPMAVEQTSAWTRDWLNGADGPR